MATNVMNEMSRKHGCVDFGQILDQKANIGQADIFDWQNLKDSVVQICDYLGLHKRRRFELMWLAGLDGAPTVAADWVADITATHCPSNRQMIIVGSAATSALCTVGADGGIVLTTAGTFDGDEMTITPNTGARATAWSQVTWGTDRMTRFECDIVNGADITTVESQAGLAETNALDKVTDDDYVKFIFPTGETNWFLAWDIANAGPYYIDTGVVFAAAHRLHMIIDIDVNRIARGYINGVLVGTTPALTAIDLIPFVTVGATGAADARAMTVYSIGCSREYGA